MKYKEIIKIIKNISLALPDVQSFYTGDVYEVNADQSVKYSSIVLTNQEHSFDNINDKFQYNFILFYIDRLTDDEANRTDIHTAAVSALKNIVQHLEDYNVIINDFKFNLFRERFNDSCAGAYATLSVEVEDNDCNEDFDFTYGQISADKLKEISITSNGTYTPDEGYYYTKVSVDVQPQLQNKSVNINENGQRTVEADSDYDGLKKVNLNVDIQPPLQSKSVEINENGTSKITADSDYYGIKDIDINVNVPIPEFKSSALFATENNKWYIASDEGLDGYEAVNVSVPEPKLIDHTAIYVENGSYKLTPSNADGFSSVNVRVDVPNPQLTVLNATENGHYEAVDSGFYGYSAVEVNVPIPTFTTGQMRITENGIYRASQQGVDGFDAVEVDVSQTASTKYVVRNGMKFAFSQVFIPDDFDVSNVTHFADFFYQCFKLESLDLSTWNANVDSISNIFYNCDNLRYINLNNWNVSNVVSMNNLFFSCGSVVSIFLNQWDMRAVTSVSSMFYNCRNLINLSMEGAILPKIDLDNWGLSTCTALTIVSLESVLNALPQLPDGTSYTCSLGSTNLAKLTDEQIAIATNKNWVLS